MINNLTLATVLVVLIAVAILLLKYIKIFNSIHENTEIIKKDLKALNRVLTADEKDAFMKAFD